LWRKKYFLLLPTLLASVIGIFGVRLIVPVYKSSSLVRMEDQTPLFEDVPQLMAIEERRSALDEETLARMQAEIKSAQFLDQLIQHLGLADNADLVAAARMDRANRFPDLSTEELVLRRLRSALAGKIEVTATGPGLFLVAAFDNSPKTAYIVANAVIDVFLESQRTKELKWLREASEFSDEQLDVYRVRLEETEREFERVQSELTALALQKNPVGETSLRHAEASGSESNLRYAESIKEQLETVIIERESNVNKTRDRLTEQLGTIPRSNQISDDPKLLGLERGLLAFYQTQLVLRLGARGIASEDQAASRAAIRQEELRLQHYVTERVTAIHTDISEDYKPLIAEYVFQVILLRGARATNDRLAADIAAYKDKLDRTPRLEAELEKLRHRVTTDRELHDSFLKAKTSAQITEAARNTELGMTIEIIEKPVRPLRPDRPNRMGILVFIVVIGGSLGFMGLVVSEYMDSSFRSVEEIEDRLDMRVLGTIPSADVASTWNRPRNRKQVVVWVVVSLAAITLSVGGFYWAREKTQKQGIRIYAAPTTEQGQK
jgi:uncharacterized protein involved in exopolysaccharide biosynthesis